MCGIFVAFNFGDFELNRDKFMDATKLVTHRGPDNIGCYSDGYCFLGHTRLSIIDIREMGNQPFFFQDLMMVYNGEIFNYVELREELIGLGYQFETESDTEVVLKCFHKWGVECFSKFNGMWAIVIHNKKTKSLIASRDRFGQKPLFLFQNGKGILFASEVQQLVPFTDKEIDYGSIQRFLKEGTYESDGRTFFKSIEEFPPAHYSLVDLSGRVKSHRYWDYWEKPIKRVSENDFKEFETLFQDAVKLRMRSDVPFGVLLSGGVDSTIVSAYSRLLSIGEPWIPAFSYASKDSNDESKYAKKVADKLKMSLLTREQDSFPEEYCKRLKRLVKHMGRGHSSLAIVSVDYLYESVSKAGIKVALDGQGADELLAGYQNYFLVMLPFYISKGQVKQAYYHLKDQLRFGIRWSILIHLRNILPASLRKLGRWFYGYEMFFRSYKCSYKKNIINAGSEKGKNKNRLNRYLIRRHKLGLKNLLYYGDIVAMNNSVENRSPFMDHRLVDFVYSRNEKLKIWNGVDKYALRTLPIYREFKEVLDRKKIGFSSDIKKDTKHRIIEELKLSGIAEWPIFSKKIKNFINSEMIYKSKYEPFVFRLYQVHLWHDIFYIGKEGY